MASSDSERRNSQSQRKCCSKSAEKDPKPKNDAYAEAELESRAARMERMIEKARDSE